MRRVLVTLTVLGLMVFAGAALAESNSNNYLDKFSSVSYSGSDGSLHWPTTWKETLETDGPSSGKVRVGEHDHCKGSKCLIIGGEELLTAGDGAYRLADLSVFEKARLSYAVGFESEGDIGLGTAELVVEVSIDGGTTWVPVDTVGLSTEQDPVFRSVDVTNFIGSGFGARFTVTGALGTRVLVDEVEVEGSAPAPTTTTTTSTTTTSTSTTTTSTTTTTIPKLSATSTTTTTATTTTSTSPTTTTTNDPGAGGPTTTLDSGETSTTVVAGAGGDDDDSGGDGADLQAGLRQTTVGVESDVPRGLFGSMPEVLGFEVAAGYANAVELIEASWVWVLGLALIIAAALIKGIDRRFDPEPTPDSTA